MYDIKEKVRIFLEKYNLLKSENIVLIAFSGGYDSLCLLNVMKTLHKNIIAIHLNHNWRGAESLSDELFCENFCKNNGIEFYSETLGAEIPKTETAAREARYKFFENCAEKFKSKIVLTAHNADDNAETLIYRIAKGTGISGLSGIAENRGIYYRPILNITRQNIEKYCTENNLQPISDSSNENLNYKRNFIRYKILPLLAEINSGATNMINSLSKMAENDNKIINEYIKSIENPLHTKVFIGLSKELQSRLVYNVFTENNLDYNREKISNALDFIIKNSKSKSGKKCSLASDLWLFVNEKNIELIRATKIVDFSKKITECGDYECGNLIFSIEKCTKTPNIFPTDAEKCAYVDLSGFEKLTIRSRKDGDIIYPLNAGGSQKLKKFLNEKKIAAHKKDELLFLCSKNEILWAPGFAVSDKIKVVKSATHVLKLTNKN